MPKTLYPILLKPNLENFFGNAVGTLKEVTNNSNISTNYIGSNLTLIYKKTNEN